MILDVHPFLKSYTSSGFYNTLPPQMIPYKDKIRKADKQGISPWMARNMDAFETIARTQYQHNLKLVENERLVNGEFIPGDYIEADCDDCEESFLDPLQELVKDGGLPHFIKHYDMISSIIKTQVEEFDQAPDTLTVVGHGEEVENDRARVQKNLLMKWANEELEIAFQQHLEDQGINPQQEFENEEQKAQFDQQIEQMRQERTPAQIGKYMKFKWRHFAEQWATFELEDQKDRFQLSKMRRKEFREYLTVGRRFRLIKGTPHGLTVEPLNYVNVFYQKAPNVDYIQDGNYAGTIQVLTAADIINRYGLYMTEAQMKSFEDNANLTYNQAKPTKDLFGNIVDYTAIDGNPYNTWMPTYSPYLNSIAPNLGMNWLQQGQGLMGEHDPFVRMFVCTEAYWRSYKRVGRLAWNNPETGVYEVIKVDESFIVPDYIKVLKEDAMASDPLPNTIVWTQEEEIWEGVKINHYHLQGDRSPVYLNIKPMDFQGSSSYRFFGKKLPIAGQIANHVNTKSGNQVDLLKPYQFMFNIFMNKAVKYAERALAAFLLVDVNTLPNQEGWGGKDALAKWLNGGEETGVAAMDTSPSNTRGANQGGHFPRVIDIDYSARILQYINIANSVRQIGLGQLGFAPQRLGDMKASETATGIDQSLAKSYNATGSWASDYWECEKDIIKMQLDVAQYLQSKNMDFTALLSKGIISEGWLTVNNNDFDLYDLRVYITNSQEELRQLEMYKRLAIDNNTVLTKMSTRMEMAGMNNAQMILQVVKEEEAKAEQLQARQRELEQQQAQVENEIEQAKLDFDREKLYAEIEAQKEIAWIKSRGYLGEGEQDLDASGAPDAFEYEKFRAQSNLDYDKLGVAKDKMALERQKETARRQEKAAEMALKLQDLQLKREQMLQTAQNVKYLDKGKYSSK